MAGDVLAEPDRVRLVDPGKDPPRHTPAAGIVPALHPAPADILLDDPPVPVADVFHPRGLVPSLDQQPAPVVPIGDLILPPPVRAEHLDPGDQTGTVVAVDQPGAVRPHRLAHAAHDIAV